MVCNGASVRWISLGTWYPAMSLRRCDTRSETSTGVSGRGTTKATTPSPHSPSGAPTMATDSTDGCETKVPARWKFGITIRPTSSEFESTDGSVAATRNHLIKAPCEIGTPLGVAVVPDV